MCRKEPYSLCRRLYHNREEAFVLMGYTTYLPTIAMLKYIDFFLFLVYSQSIFQWYQTVWKHITRSGVWKHYKIYYLPCAQHLFIKNLFNLKCWLLHISARHQKITVKANRCQQKFKYSIINKLLAFLV